MFKNMMLGLLALTLVGSLGIILVDGIRSDTSSAATPAQTMALSTATPLQALQGTPIQNAANNVGDEWIASGEIITVDDFGLTLQLENGEEVYIELGPPTYWQAQGLAFFAGELIHVDGFALEDQYHARIVTKADGSQLVVRSETGQPLWSSGSQNTQANAQTSEPQVQIDEWVTFEGIIAAIGRNSLTVETTDGQTLVVQTGQGSFMTSQGISFAVGEALSMTGFWQSEQFLASQITKTATNETLLLRDPNGRPLWGGPGRGQGGQHTPTLTPSTSGQ